MSWIRRRHTDPQPDHTDQGANPMPDITDTAAPISAPPAPPTTHREADTQITDTRPACPVCRGSGHTLTTRDYLDEIIGFLPAGDDAKMDAFVAEFYKRLLAQAPHLADLFPDDLVTGTALSSRGKAQRDLLLGALVALLSMYDPDHPDSAGMQRLNADLARAGRSHATFDRPEGGATPDEYLVVRDVLYSLLVEAVGTRWELVHTRALLRAYHHAMTEMLYAAQHFTTLDGQQPVHSRQPRAAR